jgi:hypothetical protein
MKFVSRTVFLIFAMIFCGCAQSLKPLDKFVYPAFDIPLQLGHGNNEVRILYVTCGMMVIQKGDHAFFFDPYFSYQKTASILFSLKTRKRFYEDFQHRLEATIDKNAVTTGFVSHSHYDHLVDLPVLLHDNYFPNLKTIYGNEFVSPMMYHYRNMGTTISTIEEEQLYNPVKKNSVFDWIKVSDSIEVLPIASMHAPHKFGVLAMRGKLREKYFKKEKFKDPYARSKGFKWDVGCAYSFLIRFTKPDGNYFKIFVQTSGSNAPYGLPPDGEKADLALLCLASIQEVTNYPDYLVRALQPKKVMLIHWEDFFRYPRHVNDLKIVRGTNKNKAKERLEAIRQLPFSPEVMMPKPGTLIKVKF